uniref:EEV126 n=1 Tax=Strongyloides papillosus TaxID=174720 RepID=A0A0N5B4X5_STREA
MKTNDILLTIDDIIDTLVGSFLVIIIIAILILLSIIIINVLILIWYICKFIISLILIPCYKISEYVKNLNNPKVRDDENYFITSTLGHLNNVFNNGNTYNNAIKCDKNTDDQSFNISSKLNCPNFVCYEETTYITMPSEYDVPALLHKDRPNVRKDSVQLTLYTL